MMIRSIVLAALLVVGYPIDSMAAAQSMQQQRQAFIKKMIAAKVIYKIEKPGSLCHLYTGAQFGPLDIDQKTTVVGVVYGYCVGNDARANIVVLKDHRTGKRIGSFSASGGLDLK